VAQACGTSTGNTAGFDCLCAATVEGDCGCWNEAFTNDTVACETSFDCIGVTPTGAGGGTPVGVSG
jgi:hypothetical protein